MLSQLSLCFKTYQKLWNQATCITSSLSSWKIFQKLQKNFWKWIEFQTHFPQPKKKNISSIYPCLIFLPFFSFPLLGWVCYAEKTHGSYILPHISTTKSPQQIMGSLVKDYLAQIHKKRYRLTTSHLNRQSDLLRNEQTEIHVEASRQTEKWTDRQLIDWQTDRWTDNWLIDRWIDRQKEKWIYRQTGWDW